MLVEALQQAYGHSPEQGIKQGYLSASPLYRRLELSHRHGPWTNNMYVKHLNLELLSAWGKVDDQAGKAALRAGGLQTRPELRRDFAG